MKIVRENHGRTALLSVAGQGDMRTSPDLRRHLRRAVRDRCPLVVVDLHGVDFIDSSGLATLIEAVKDLSQHSGQLKLVGLGPAVRKLFDLSNLTSIFDIHDTREDALGT